MLSKMQLSALLDMHIIPHYINFHWMSRGVQWNPSNLGQHGDHDVCPKYRGVHIFDASSIFLVGMAMHTCAVEHYESAFQSSPLLYTGKKVCSSV